MFDALEIAHQMIDTLPGLLARVRSKDPDLYKQIRRAANSVTLNISEGARRAGGDRKHLWRVAAGSAAEVRTALRNAVSWGDLTARQTKPTLELLDRVIAMLWKMTH